MFERSVAGTDSVSAVDPNGLRAPRDRSRWLTDTRTGRPDKVVERTHYTQWQTIKNAFISRHDLQKGYFRLPTIEDVANWIREALATRSQQQIKWLFDHFGGDGNCLMAKAIERYPEELIMIYEAYD